MKNIYILPLMSILSCYSYTANAVDVYPKKANKLQSYEFGQLIKDYMPNTGDSKAWVFNTNNSNIFWDRDITKNEYMNKFEKEGYIRINFDGFTLKESSYNNPNSRSEASWGITYYGDNIKNVDIINIEHSLTAGMINTVENEKIKPFKSLIKEGITYKPVCFYKMTGANYSIAYELSSPNRKEIYLVETNSSGSGGLSTFYDLFDDKKKMYAEFNNTINKTENLCLPI